MDTLGPITLAWLILAAAAVAQLVSIGRTDFMTQKISNASVGLLLLTAVAVRAVDFYWHYDPYRIDQSASLNLEASVILAAVLFAVTFVFWLFRKIGAGDVKLLAVVGLLVGFQASIVFAIFLLACTVLTYIVMKQPLLLPERMFREYVASLARYDRVPFGVPISTAAILTLAYAIAVAFLA